MSTIFVFPGQGSQIIGMGRDLADAFPEARAVFSEVDDALGRHLTRIMWDGSESDLNLTENTQPALMSVSVAVARVIMAQTGKTLPQLCTHVAGHSLGEYSALCTAGTFSLADCARLLQTRGRAMQAAVPVGVGAMAAILGLDFADVAAIALDAQTAVNDGQVVQAANDNSSGQVVVSGHVGAVNAAMKLATDRGAKRAVLLPVSAPFHSSLMQPAADVMRGALATVAMQAPCVPVMANVTAAPVSDVATIRDLLVAQVTGTVRWRETVAGFKNHGLSRVVELGSGKVLSGLVKRIDGDLTILNAGTVAEVESLMKVL